MHTDVETYFASVDAYRSAYEKAVNEANEANSDGLNYALRDARARVASANRALALIETWAELKKSEDPLVAFIGRECGQHTSYAEEILKVLPTTLDHMREIAREKGWCSEWDEFVAKARREGVIEPMTDQELISEMMEKLRGRYGVYRNELNAYKEQLNTIIERAREEGRQEVRQEGMDTEPAPGE
jgi:small-conductance mechanosensitive channel